MAASNPNPTRIPDAIWRLWTEWDAISKSALLGGIYASKPGYHNFRNALPSSDYSAGRDVLNDKKDAGTKASALDVTLSDAEMKLFTERLDRAARTNDPRLKYNGQWILREFIGTKDGKTVYCWVFTGGRPLGVGADSGPDPGRSKSHLWHIHLSVIRRFLNHWPALSQIFSIVKGESLQKWQAGRGVTVSKTTEDKILEIVNELFLIVHDGVRLPIENQTVGGRPVAWLVRMFWEMKREIQAVGAGVAAVGAAVANVDEETAAKLNDQLESMRKILESGLPGIDGAVVAREILDQLPTDLAKSIAEEYLQLYTERLSKGESSETTGS